MAVCRNRFQVFSGALRSVFGQHGFGRCLFRRRRASMVRQLFRVLTVCNMKQIFVVSAVLLSAAAAFGQSAPQQSLGDLARAARAHKRAAATPDMVFDNDSFVASAPVNVVGKVEPESATDSKSTQKSGEAKPAADDRKKAESEWRDKITAQKKAIADIDRELDLLQREYKLRQVAYYADAGVQLRDSKKWADEDRKYRDDISDRAKKAQDAKQKLEDLREQGRKAGIPSSALD